MKLFKARPNYHRYYSTKPKWILPTALGIATLGTASTLQERACAESSEEPQQPVKQPNPRTAIEERYRKELAEEERKIADEMSAVLCAELRITKEEYESKKAEHYKAGLERYSKAMEDNIKEDLLLHPEQLSPSLKNLIIKLLKSKILIPI